MPHSPEPWAVVNKQTSDYFSFLGIDDATGHAVLGEITGDYESMSPNVPGDDVRRIVACINACFGWTTDELANHQFLKTGTTSQTGRPVAHLAIVHHTTENQ